MRKELQVGRLSFRYHALFSFRVKDTYSKLLDLTVLANRPYDSGSWIRRPQKEALSTSGRESPLLRGM